MKQKYLKLTTKCLQCFDDVRWQHEWHPAHKNFCLKAPWQVGMAVNVRGLGTAQTIMWISRVSSCPANSILEFFEYFCQMSSKLTLIIFSYNIPFESLRVFSKTQCI